MQSGAQLDFNSAIDTGSLYLQQMVINHQLINYLIKLAELLDNSQLSVIQESRIECLQESLYAIIAEDPYYLQSIDLLKSLIISPTNQPFDLTDKAKENFLTILRKLSIKRDSPQLEIDELSMILNPSIDTVVIPNVPIYLQRGQTSFILRNLFGEKQPLLTRKNAKPDLFQGLPRENSQDSLSDSAESFKRDNTDEDINITAFKNEEQDFRTSFDMYEHFSSARSVQHEENNTAAKKPLQNHENNFMYAFRKMIGILSTFSIFKCCYNDSAREEHVSSNNLRKSNK